MLYRAVRISSEALFPLRTKKKSPDGIHDGQTHFIRGHVTLNDAKENQTNHTMPNGV